MVRFKLLRGLGRLRADRPELPVDEEALHGLAARVVRRALDLLAWRVALAAPPGEDDVLAALLADKERLALERLFRIVGILRPRDELELVYDGLHSRDRRRRDAAVELIAATVSPALRPAVLALVDDGLGDAERLARAGVPRPSTAAALAAMAADHSEPIAALAARRAAVPRAA